MAKTYRLRPDELPNSEYPPLRPGNYLVTIQEDGHRVWHVDYFKGAAVTSQTVAIIFEELNREADEEEAQTVAIIEELNREAEA